ncbi:phage terminase large subunit [bacterium]|nr:phage terminase large subunit [bacterium]
MPYTPSPALPQTDFDVERGRRNLEYFAQYFFPRHCRYSFSPLHRYLFSRRAEKIASDPPHRHGQLDVVIAPRGAAKSTIMSLVFPIHALLYETDPYIVLFSATQRQASQRLSNIHFLVNDKSLFAKYFPKFYEGKSPRASSRSLTFGEGRMEAFSAGAEVRGINHGAWRPTWIILDDVERSDRVRSLRHRDTLAEWFDEVVANLGNGYTNIDLIGTLLHRDALPVRIGNRPDTVKAQFASIISEASDQTLWDQWRALYQDLNDPGRLLTARAFFDEHRDAMLAGASVLWEQKEDYYALSALRERIGRRAFDKEKQNEPANDEDALFNVQRLRRFRIDRGKLICEPMVLPSGDVPDDGARPTVNISDLSIGGFIDPALGARGGDYAAIVTVATDGVGYAYVLDVWIEVANTSRQVEKIFELNNKWNYDFFGVETVGFQAMLMDSINTASARHRDRGEKWQITLKQMRPRGTKLSRIAHVEPFAASGWLMFNEDLDPVFIDQLENYPNGPHDDGPDALAAAFTLLRDHVFGPLKTSTVSRKQKASSY